MDKRFQERDLIIFHKEIDWENREYPIGVCQRFDELRASDIQRLIDLGFMKEEDTMNSTPTIREFLQFAKTLEKLGYQFNFEGFTFDPRSAQNGVLLEGIYLNDPYSPEVELAFLKFVTPFSPDELTIEPNQLRAWWD